jgi:SAM-dependent methyltransferase
MKFALEHIDLTCPEPEIYNRLLSLDNKHILELGCGHAQKTREIATSGANRRISAFEVDEIAHKNNLQITDLPNVHFGLSGAQDIPLDDESVDVVFMFKSLHHVPTGLMEQSLGEIRRVLKPAGLAYISEPVFAGEFNEILRLFNDEKKVRKAAFNSLKKAVDTGQFKLVEELFFNTPGHYENFAAFEKKIINATHSQYLLDEPLHLKVRQLFEQHMGADGAVFSNPVRVDLLQK